MKTNRFILVGIIALVAIMGFTFVACNKGGSASSDKKDGGSASESKIQYAPESDFEAEPIDGGKSVRITKYIGDKWEVNIPPKIRDLPVTSIGYENWSGKIDAFQSKNLISVTIPNSVTIIGERAFRYNQLTSVTIPNSVTTIGDSAFEENKLISVTIGANVTFGPNEWSLPFYNGFEAIYNNGKAAGTYTRPNADSENWTKQ